MLMLTCSQVCIVRSTRPSPWCVRPGRTALRRLPLRPPARPVCRFPTSRRLEWLRAHFMVRIGENPFARVVVVSIFSISDVQVMSAD